MGKRGPARTPTNLQLLQGVDKKNPQRVNKAEPTPGVDGVVPPEDMPASALEVWNRLAPDLIAKRVLTRWDVDLFARFCRAVPVARDAWSDVEEHGASCTTVARELSNGTLIYDLKRNPAWQVAREATAVMTTIGSRFGLTPSDRAGLTTEQAGDGNPGQDILSG